MLEGSRSPLWIAVLVSSAGFGARLALQRRPRAALAASALLAIAASQLLTSFSRSRDPGLSALVLDVGHGDAILVRSGQQAWMIDAGPRFGRFDAGRHVVLPALRAEGINRLDALVLTHSDRDHLGGAVSLIRSIPIGEVWLSRLALDHSAARPLRRVAARQSVPLRIVSAGHVRRIGKLEVRVLWPPRNLSRATSNESSIVLRMSDPRGCVMLPGDAPASVERRLAPGVLPCELLKLAHHGSSSSSDPLWLERLSPSAAIASAGRRRGAPLPHLSVRKRLRGLGVALYETSRQGAIRAHFGRAGLEIEPFLEAVPGATSKPVGVQ